MGPHLPPPYSNSKVGQCLSQVGREGRACIAGASRYRNRRDDNPLMDVCLKPVSMGGAAAASGGTKTGSESFTLTSGFYNALILKSGVKLLCRCVLPRLHIEGREHAGVPLFMRRETWIERNGRVGGTPAASAAPGVDFDAHSAADLDECIGVFFIQLIRRFARLDFADWLFGKQDWGHGSLRLATADRVFLTDGWADLVLLVHRHDATGQARRREHLFAMQSDLAAHILVRRVETVLTPRSPAQAGYPTFLSIGLDETSPQRLGRERALEKLRGAASNRTPPPQLWAIPGSTDITVVFDGKGGDAMKSCLEWLEASGVGADVDRLLVQVGAPGAAVPSGDEPC